MEGRKESSGARRMQIKREAELRGTKYEEGEKGKGRKMGVRSIQDLRCDFAVLICTARIPLKESRPGVTMSTPFSGGLRVATERSLCEGARSAEKQNTSFICFPLVTNCSPCVSLPATLFRTRESNPSYLLLSLLLYHLAPSTFITPSSFRTSSRSPRFFIIMTRTKVAYSRQSSQAVILLFLSLADYP